MTLLTDIKTLATEIRRPALKKFPRRHVYADFPNQFWGADLVDMSNIKTKNMNVTFLLNIVDIYSRYAWSIPLKNKSGKAVYDAFESIGVAPENLWVDQGTEFYNAYVKGWCKVNGVNMYSTSSGLKSVFVERFNRTEKEAFGMYFAEHLTTKYTKFIPVFLNQYNHKKHSATKETPYDVYNKIVLSREPVDTVNVRKHKFNVGDYVRVSMVKRTFEKGYSDRFTHEVFQVTKVDMATAPVMYQLQDLKKEPITGKFYEQELTATKIPEFKLIKSILKRKTENGVAMVLVDYVGYDDAKFNEWIKKSDYDAFMKEKKKLAPK